LNWKKHFTSNIIQLCARHRARGAIEWAKKLLMHHHLAPAQSIDIELMEKRRFNCITIIGPCPPRDPRDACTARLWRVLLQVPLPSAGSKPA
jgi:hypothetical protein